MPAVTLFAMRLAPSRRGLKIGAKVTAPLLLHRSATTHAFATFVMVGLVPTIHLTVCSGVPGWLDPRDKPEDDSGSRVFD
jgi:hypothetical protein